MSDPRDLSLRRYIIVIMSLYREVIIIYCCKSKNLFLIFFALAQITTSARLTMAAAVTAVQTLRTELTVPVRRALRSGQPMLRYVSYTRGEIARWPGCLYP